MSGAGVVAVTGGSSGIGLAIARQFLKLGYGVAVCSRSRPPRALSCGIEHFRVDVRLRKQMFSFVGEVKKRLGPLNIFVNCAGVSRWRPLGQIDEKFASEVIDTGVLGTLWGCAAAAHAMRSSGCIINVSSLAGKRGSANNSAYCAAKFAVNGITQALAKELGPRGIRVNAVCPVYVETEHIVDSLRERFSPAQGRPVGAYLSQFAKSQAALGRLPKAEEIAEAVAFLASDKASAITGQCINVDCGVLPQ